MVAPPLYLDYEDKTDEVCSQFVVLKSNQYISRLKNIYSAADESMTCDCPVDIDDSTGINHACGEDSDCINRLTNIECVNDECTCGDDCQNQRFQRCQYANTSIFLTENKGYGMRANVNIPANTFLIEYIGDIIDQEEYKTRKEQYDKEGLKHFYFMMIQDNEIIDASKRASLARYCNHSCDPNAYVDKWVVNKRYRMGIFAKRDIVKGEEICFDYNVDRYGAEPQTCYCGASNCLGVLGGKTQSESVRLLPHSITEALGVIANDEKKWIKEQKNNGIKITKDNIDSNVNVEFVKSLYLKPLEINEVAKVVGCLMQPDLDLLVVSRIFERILLNTNDFEELIRRLNRLHGLKVLGNSVKVLLSSVHNNSDLDNLQLTMLNQTIKILQSWPSLKSKNSVQASNLEESFNKLVTLNLKTDLKNEIESILQYWSSLKMEYRIPKKEKNSSSSPKSSTPVIDERRNKSSTENLLRKLPNAPSSAKKPWSGIDVSRLASNKVIDGIPLPTGWEWATDPKRGKKYYFNRVTGQTTWEKPEWEDIKREDQEEEKRMRRERERQIAETERIRELEKERALERIKVSKMEEERANELSDIIIQAQRATANELARKRAEEEKEERKREKKQKAVLERAAIKAKAKSKSRVRISSSEPTVIEDDNKKSTNSSFSAASFQSEKKWVILFAKYVPHMIKKYEEQIGRDNLKLFAKDISHILASKECQRHGDDYEIPKGLSEDRQKKVKLFSKDYVHRQLDKMKEKKRKKQEQAQVNENGLHVEKKARIEKN